MVPGALNRLSTVQESGTGTTTYGYDNVGNLQSVTYPNGVVHSYGYDTRNRLTNLGVAKGTTQLSGYSYILDAAGHRLNVTELSGRVVNYSYDNLYRLTNETIASDPSGINGTVNYTYDPVGNRKQLTSTLAPVPAGLWNYDVNDRLTAGDSYDANGNTTASGGIGNVYDFENHLIQKGGVTIVYDGDGNRVQKTVAGTVTKYLVDTQNPTGYAQVVSEEAPNGLNLAVYVYGLERISKAFYSTQFGGPQGFRYYVYDGHGSMRALADTSGNVTDTYDYDAFGNLIHSTFTAVPPLGNSVAPTPNNYLYSGEQFDPDLNLYYNRARYLNVSTGRFWTTDPLEGTSGDPGSQHRYLYAFGSPIGFADPSGRSGNSIFNIFGNLVQKKIFLDYETWRALRGHIGFTNKSIKTILGLPPAPRGDDIYDRPDIADVTDQMIYEIKPKLAGFAATGQIAGYIALILENGGGVWGPGTNFSAPQDIPLLGGAYIAHVDPTDNGAILYTVSSRGPLDIPVVPIPITVETITEEAIRQEQRVANAADEADVKQTELTAPLLTL